MSHEPADPVHDVLAADEFALPAPDEFHHSGPVILPGDPAGASPPHDILAAEDFAFPAASPPLSGRIVARPGGRARLVAEVAAMIAAVGFLLRRRRR